jgi:hypothetical protein
MYTGFQTLILSRGSFENNNERIDISELKGLMHERVVRKKHNFIERKNV